MRPGDVTPQFDPTSDLLDVDGRPVGEIGSRHYERIDTEIVACPYADARRGHPMNHTALRQLSACWSDVLAAGAWLAGQGHPRGSVHAAWWATMAGTRAPAIHHDLQGDEPVPRVLSALYKASLGFSQVLTAVLLAGDGIADTPLRELGDADAFLELLDREGWLVGEQQACAGPAPMIGQLFEAFAGTSEVQPDPGPLAALAPVRPWTDMRATWVAIHVAFLGAARPLDAHLSPGIPCLRGVLAVPHRQPEHARRLFPRGAAPQAVESFLSRCAALGLEELVTLRAQILSGVLP